MDLSAWFLAAKLRSFAAENRAPILQAKALVKFPGCELVAGRVLEKRRCFAG
jgi:hypothetical protein